MVKRFQRFEYLFKNYVIFWGGGGRSSKDYIGLQGGGLGSPKKDYVIFEWFLILIFVLALNF